MQVVDVIRRYNIRVRIVNQRGTSYDIVSSMLGEQKGVVPVFPALNNRDLGFERSPEYFVGTFYDIAYRNAMIEFKHVTKLADEFNSREYAKFIR